MSTIETPPLNRLPVNDCLRLRRKAHYSRCDQSRARRQGRFIFMHQPRSNKSTECREKIVDLVPQHASILDTANGSDDAREVMARFVAEKSTCSFALPSSKAVSIFFRTRTRSSSTRRPFRLGDLYSLDGRVGRAEAQRLTPICFREMMTIGAARKRN